MTHEGMAEPYAEVSFRIWDPERQEMVYDTFVASKSGAKGVWMEMSGLYDKNGKEIGAGDIHEFEGLHFVVCFGHFYDMELNTSLYGWFLDDPQGEGIRLDGESEEWVNIVGNGFENPELLKGALL